MPKIIENLESKLTEEAKKQIEQVGYGAMTIRSVAKACGVGVGTVYNYFSSKEDLIASYLLEDWKQCITAINAVSTYSDYPRAAAFCIYDQLVSFSLRHQSIFRDEAAAASFAGSFGLRFFHCRTECGRADYLQPESNTSPAFYLDKQIATSA